MAQNNDLEVPNVSAQYYRNEPYVLITEQPATDRHIFRYAAEISVKEAKGSEFRKKDSGSIVGVNSKPGNKTYPTIKVMGYQGPYLVVVSCVGKDGPPYRPHPNNLYGTGRCNRGVYANLANNIDMTHSLENVAIECVKKKDVRNSLQERKTLQIDPYLTGFEFEDSNIDLEVVRLCFQVFIPGSDSQHFSRPLEPVVSDPIQKYKTVEKLPEDLKAIMLSGDLSDILFKVKGEEFKLHRAILAARNFYFYSMFTIDMKEKNSGIVTIDDCEPDIFRTFVHFIYTGKVDKLLPENVCELYEVADKYQEIQLKKQCLDFMMKMLSEDAFCDLILLALKYDEQKLFKKALKMFASRPNKILDSVEWKNFAEKCPIQANKVFVKAKAINRQIGKEICKQNVYV